MVPHSDVDTMVPDLYRFQLMPTACHSWRDLLAAKKALRGPACVARGFIGGRLPKGEASDGERAWDKNIGPKGSGAR